LEKKARAREKPTGRDGGRGSAKTREEEVNSTSDDHKLRAWGVKHAEET